MNIWEDPGDYGSMNFESVRAAVHDIASGYEKVVALGRAVSDRLKKLDVPHFRMPHPSPRNRALNSKEYEKEMLQKCREYLNG